MFAYVNQARIRSCNQLGLNEFQWRQSFVLKETTGALTAFVRWIRSHEPHALTTVQRPMCNNCQFALWRKNCYLYTFMLSRFRQFRCLRFSYSSSSSAFDVDLLLFVVPSGRWTAPSGVGRWMFHGVCFLGNFLLARCFLFLFCGEGMTLVCASSPQGQRADFSMPIFFMWLRSLQWPVLSPK